MRDYAVEKQTDHKGFVERTFGWLSNWCGVHRERANRLACVTSLMAANALNNPA